MDLIILYYKKTETVECEGACPDDRDLCVPWWFNYWRREIHETMPLGVTWPLISPDGAISWSCENPVPTNQNFGYDKTDLITGARVRVGTLGEKCKA